MENPNVLRKGPTSVLKAVVLGGGGVAAATAGVLLTDGSYLLYVRMLIGLPAVVLKQLMGLQDAAPDSFANSIAFFAIINGILGSLFFGIASTLWKLRTKSEHES